MSTRSTAHFMYGDHTSAIIYRHTDGYPEGAGTDIYKFFDDVEEQTQDHRFNDPSYLAAKYVVWLADQFAYSYRRDEGEVGGYAYTKGNQLDFLSVGVVMEDPGDIEYRYEIRCHALSEGGRPDVVCYELGDGAKVVPIPSPYTEA